MIILGYTKYTVAIKDEEVNHFEQCLQVIKEFLNEEKTSTAIQKVIEIFPEISDKARKYDQLAEMVLAFETLSKYRKGELVHANEVREL